jgi:hypothetical protein
MPFDWLKSFHRQTKKLENYAERTLAAYRLGMKAGGSIAGVRIDVTEDCCAAARQLPPDQVYHPDDAPHLPLPNCPLKHNCQCVYRPVMSYEQTKP